VSEDDDPESAPAPPARCRGWRRSFVRAALVLGGIAVVLAVGRWQVGRVGERKLKVAVAGIDAEEPGWRLEEIEAARERAAPPPDQNAASIVLRVADLISPEREKDWNTWRNSEAWSGRVLSPHLPPDKFREGLAAHKDATAPARLLARDIQRFPAGYYAFSFSENPYMTLVPHLDKARKAAALLEYDALLAAVENDPDGGIVAAHAALNVGRSIGDEPLLISQLVRIACGRISTQTAAQVLAWGSPKRGLAELQAAYRAEAEEPWVLHGLRGERAALHRTFAGLESGKLTADDLATLGIQKPGTVHNAAFQLYKGFLPGDHAKALEILTAYITAAKLPPHEQRAAFSAVPIPPKPPEDFRYIVTRLLVPACEKVASAGIRNRAELLCASTAIACERFRLANARWPVDLAEIPKEILSEVPLDPFTGGPLRYHRFEDGIAIVSVGDGDTKTAQRQFQDKDPLAGLGIGCRLYDPAVRGSPPLPPMHEPDPDDTGPKP